MRFGTAETYGNTYNHDISINYPSTDHDYHAYNGSSHTIPFGSTVYGGTLNVTTGVLTVTHAEVDLGSLTYVRNTQYANPLFFSTIDNAKFISGSVVSNVICSIFKTVSSSVQNNVGVDNVVSCSHYFNSTYNLFITCSTYADASTFKTAMDGVQLVYELATPTEVQLTPTEVKTLLGQNNIWADTGEVEVTYYTRG